MNDEPNTGVSGGPDPTDRNLPADDRLYWAVICLLLEDGSHLLAESLRPDDITKRAGKSRASYYRTVGFAGTEAASHNTRRMVLEGAFDRALRDAAADVSQIVDAVEEFTTEEWKGLTPQEFIRVTAAENYDWLDSPVDRAQFLSASLAHSSPVIRESLAAFYQSVTADYSTAYATLLSFLGYSVRPPFTIEHFTVAVMAMAEGLLMRRSADPSITKDLYVDLIELIATSMVVVDSTASGRTVSLDQLLPRTGEPPRRSAIIDAAINLFEHGRADSPTVEELAVAANCSPQTVMNHFGGVAGAVRAAWEEWMPWFDETVEIDRRSMRDPDPLTLLYRAAIRVTQRAIEHRNLTRALLMAELGGAVSMNDRPDPISLMFERLLLDAAERGEHVTPSTRQLPFDAGRVRMFAVTLRSNLLNLVCASPMALDTTTAEHARRCVDYVWALCMPARLGPGDD